MGSHPLCRTVLAVFRMPLAVSFDDDVLHCVRCGVQDVAEVPARLSVYAGEKRESVDLPIKYQLFWFQHLLTDRAEPRRRLFHHAVPRRRIKALGMDAFLRPGREADAGVAQLFAKGMRLHTSQGMPRTYRTFQ
jgi:hypothetical protein